MAGSIITISINKHSKEVSCCSSLQSMRFQSAEVYLLGTFYNLKGEVSTPDDLFELYQNHGTQMYDALDGTGTAIIIDHLKKKVFAFTDFFNSIFPLFYGETADELIITTHLLSLTAKMKGLTISRFSAQEFMLHGMVYGRRTLISQVSKLPPKHYLEVDVNRCKIHCRKCQYTIASISAVDTAAYNASFHKCMEECYKRGAGMTLSGGFDTNYILHHLQEIKQKEGDIGRIHAYCGGGSSGTDETPLAKEMADYYGNIDLRTFHVTPESIQNFPEIVLALQGVCFEDGIFLHYQLAKKFAEDNIKYVYTGDLADQVFNSETFQYSKPNYKRLILMTLRGVKNAILYRRYDFYNWMFRGRYETAALKLLKKSGQLWDYFGTEGVYPYIRRPFMSMARSTAQPGDYSKRFHRKVVLDTVAPFIAERIQRRGGNTDPTALFDEKTKQVLRAVVMKMPWYKSRRFVNEDQQLGYELRVLYIDLVRRIFINQEFDRCRNGDYLLLKDIYPGFDINRCAD